MHPMYVTQIFLNAPHFPSIPRNTKVKLLGKDMRRERSKEYKCSHLHRVSFSMGRVNLTVVIILFRAKEESDQLRCNDKHTHTRTRTHTHTTQHTHNTHTPPTHTTTPHTHTHHTTHTHTHTTPTHTHTHTHTSLPHTTHHTSGLTKTRDCKPLSGSALTLTHFINNPTNINATLTPFCFFISILLVSTFVWGWNSLMWPINLEHSFFKFTSTFWE